MLTRKQADTTVEIRAVLCKREKEHGGGGDGRCDGRSLVCGKCDTTAHLVREALEASGRI